MRSRLAATLCSAGSDATAPITETDYQDQNAQTRKDAFLKTAQNRGATEDYLRDTRDAPLSPHEIKAGREIPAVLYRKLRKWF
jgi:hypothetical protein